MRVPNGFDLKLEGDLRDNPIVTSLRRWGYSQLFDRAHLEEITGYATVQMGSQDRSRPTIGMIGTTPECPGSGYITGGKNRNDEHRSRIRVHS